MQFNWPWAFILLLLLPALFWRRSRERIAAVAFSSIAHAARAGFSYRRFFSFLPFAARVAAIALLVVALARPRIGTEKIRDVSRGIAIMMLLDRSGSMRAEMDYHGERLTRLDVVKRGFVDFIMGDGKNMKGRPNDLLGVITFARYPDTIAPLTLEHGVLQHFVENVELPVRREEDGTAIGDAVALAAARLRTVEETLARRAGKDEPDYEIESKVILLLSDGANNAGEWDPMDAAALAKKWDITIHSIGIVGAASSEQLVRTPFGTYRMPSDGGDADEKTLKAMSDMTGGKYWRVQDGRGMERACVELDRLEKSEIESIRYVDYKEAFAPFAVAAFGFLLLELLLASTLFRRIP